MKGFERMWSLFSSDVFADSGKKNESAGSTMGRPSRGTTSSSSLFSPPSIVFVLFFCFFCFFTETTPIFMAKTDLFAVKVYPENVSKNTMAAGEDVLTLA